jgi:putative salt-induced outer membrane protein YdiY
MLQKKLFFLVLVTLPLFAQTPPEPVKAWNSSAGAGLAITSGNTDTQNINVAFNTVWDPKTNRLFKADALYLLGKSDGEKQVDKATALARYEGLFHERAFWFGEVGYLRDPFKSLDYLVSPLVGAGYHLVDTDKHKLTVDGAVGAIVESDAILGRDTSGALKAGENYEWVISKSSRFTQKLTGLWKADDLDDSFYHFETGLATTVATRLELKVSYIYDYKTRVSSPDIEKGDSALVTALVVKF